MDPLQTAPSHPSPARHRVSPVVLLVALLAAPLAWGFQTVIGMAIARYACFPKNVPLGSPAFVYAHTLIATVIVASLLVGLSGIALSFSSWRRTRTESHGDGHQLLDIGEGRSRFLAMCGLIGSIGFTGATVFAIIGLVVVPLC